MKKTMILALVALLPLAAFAGDGTKENPYTVAELNAQKDALAASGATVWVKADLKGLGEDGTRTDNYEYEENNSMVYPMAAIFGDANDTFTAFSYHILHNIAKTDWTNTENLLIALTYGTAGHPYGNLNNPTYAESKEPTTPHFSLEEVHGALTLTINNGFRGFHIGSCFIVPKGVVAATVTSNYTAAKGATITYNYFNGSDTENTYLMPNNAAIVLIAPTGSYDFVLGTGLYPQSITNSNSLHGGTSAGTNTINSTDRWHFRFIATTEKVGFERNGSNDKEVVLDKREEIYLTVNSKSTHFGGNWNWETTDKNWISWKGQTYSDFVSGISEMVKGQSDNGAVYNLQGQRVEEPAQKGIYIKNGKKYIAK